MKYAEKYAIKTPEEVQRCITTYTMYSKSLNISETMISTDFANHKKKKLISKFSTINIILQFIPFNKLVCHFFFLLHQR